MGLWAGMIPYLGSVGVGIQTELNLWLDFRGFEFQPEKPNANSDVSGSQAGMIP